MSQTASTVIETPHSTFDDTSLPNGWRWVRLGDVGYFESGGTPAKENAKYWNGHIPFVTGADIKEFYVSASNARAFLTEEGLKSGKTAICTKGAVLFVTRTRVGRVGIATETMGASQDLSPYICGEEIYPEYVCRYLLSISQQLIANCRGATIQGLTREFVHSLQIPLPLLAEQKRIAAILNEEMAAVERARAAAEAQLKAAKGLPNAYLRAVFDSPEAKHWTKKRIGDVALQVQNGIYKAAEHYGHGHPFLRMYNVQNNSWTLNLDRLALVNLEGKEEATFALKRGDLLISRVNSFELVGKCAWVSHEAEGFVFENMLIRVQLNSSVNSLFVAQQMATKSVRKQIEGVAKRAIGQASINSSDLRAVEILLPPLEVQERIANELSARIADSEQALKSLQDQLDTINKLPAALLRQAFTGKL